MIFIKPDYDEEDVIEKLFHPNQPREIKFYMTPDEIADIISDRMMEIIKSTGLNKIQ